MVGVADEKGLETQVSLLGKFPFLEDSIVINISFG